MPALRALGPAALLVASVFWVGCGNDEAKLVDPVSLSHGAEHSISGNLLGPDGTNICNTVGEGELVVRLLNPDWDFTNDPFLGEQFITCPDNSYSFSINAATAHVRAQLPINDAMGSLPWRELDHVPLDDEVLTHDMTFLPGTEVGGLATLDGNPFEGVGFEVLHDFNPNFASAFASSGPDGRWVEFFGRSPMILRDGERFQAFTDCFAILGTRVQSQDFPPGGFEFPSEASAFNCGLETGPATRFSHTFTRLVVTPLPGDIGGSITGDFFDRYGVGWGVQFPVARGESPIHGNNGFSHIFNGGLMIGIGTDQVLTGADASTMMQCGATCRDLGLDGTLKFSRGPGKRQVKWRYTDAPSAEAAGLEIKQKSVDGKLPNDYVLFRFSIKNTSRSSLTFYAGFFGDWDIDFDAADDQGATELGGKLMYEVSQAESGVHAGTLLLGAPITGNYFFDGIVGTYPSTADQIRALRGGLREETLGPGDLRYIQGAGPITLKKNQSRDLWIAVVAGESRAQLLANAAAAQADVAGRANESIDNDAGLIAMTAPRAAQAANRVGSRMSCKTCKTR